MVDEVFLSRTGYRKINALAGFVPYVGASQSLIMGLFDITANRFHGPLTGNVTGNVSGNAATVTTNANLTGPITSIGNATSISNSVNLPGSPTTTTQSPGDNSTKIATTAYVDAGGGGSTTLAALTDVIVDPTNYNMLLGNPIPSGTIVTNTAQGNISLGISSLSSLTTGSENYAFGTFALNVIDTGSQNIGVGTNALAVETSGSGNVAIGISALNGQNATDNNTAIGFNAGSNITSGTQNLYIGYNSNASSGAVTNEIAVGASSTGNGSNTIQIGNASITDVYLGAPTTTILHTGKITNNGTNQWSIDTYIIDGAIVATGYVTITIDGTPYKLLAST